MTTVGYRIVLLAVLLGAALAVNNVDECPAFTGTLNPYDPDSFPANCSAVTTCMTERCTCQGQTYDAVSGECTGTQNVMDCDTDFYCFGTFATCLMLEGSNQSCGDWSTYLEMRKVDFLLNTQLTYNTSELYQACARVACHYVNQTAQSCLPKWDGAATCYQAITNSSQQSTQAPLGGGATPVATNPDGSPTKKVKVIHCRIKFNGDFSKVFANGNSSGNATLVKGAVYTAIVSFLGYDIVISAIYEGSLVVIFHLLVDFANTALADQLANNVGLMTQGVAPGGTPWYNAIVTACQQTPGGCPFGITSIISAVSYIEIVNGTPAASGLERKCETRCIAFIVIGIVVTLTVIIAAAIIYKKRSEEQGTGQSATEMDNKRERAANPLA